MIKNTVANFFKQLLEEDFIYCSYQSVHDLKNDIEYILTKKNRYDLFATIGGVFVSDLEFVIAPKSIIARTFNRMLAHLSGEIFQDDKKSTCVKLTVRPNLTFAFMFFLSPLIGLIGLHGRYVYNETSHSLVEAFLEIILMPTLMMMMARYGKNKIKNGCVKAFNLKPIE